MAMQRSTRFARNSQTKPAQPDLIRVDCVRFDFQPTAIDWHNIWKTTVKRCDRLGKVRLGKVRLG